MDAMRWVELFIVLACGRLVLADATTCLYEDSCTSLSALNEGSKGLPQLPYQGTSLLQRRFAVDGHHKSAKGEKESSRNSLTSMADVADSHKTDSDSVGNAGMESAQMGAASMKGQFGEQASSLAQRGGGHAANKERKVSWGLCLVLVALIACNLWLVWYFSAQDKLGPDKTQHELFNRNENGKVYVYSNEQLLTWWVLLTKTPAIVMSWQVWIVGPCVLSLAYGFALMVVFEAPFANMIDTKRIDEFGKYLRVFIAFMLGLFMNNSFQRWHSSVSLFRAVLTSVKQMMFTASMMNVRTELMEELQRKCLIACYVLDAEVRTDLSCKASACKEHWDNTWKFLEEAGLLTEEEEQAIQRHRESRLDMDMGGHSTMIWAWIGQLISRIREEPGVLVPMYVRMVSISHSCLGQVDQLKTAVHVQVPFTYAYLLSTIVHLNNILLALCSGLAIGASLSGLDADDNAEASASLLSLNRLYDSGPVVAMQTVILLIQPLMYQACLVIAHVLNHPFGDQVFHLPTETFIILLRDELQISADCFKNKPQVAVPAAHNAESSGEDDDSSGGGGDEDCDD